MCRRQPELLGDDVLALLEDLRAQLDVARLVDAVHVAEGRGQQVDALLAEPERLRGGHEVAGGGVELLVDLVARRRPPRRRRRRSRAPGRSWPPAHFSSSSCGDLAGSRRARSPSRPTCATGTAAPGRRRPAPATARSAAGRSRRACPSGSGRCAARRCTGYFSATTCANSASATAPVTMSFTLVPEANSAPPVENWMMPSLPASAKPAQRGVDRLRRGAVDRRVGEAALLGPADHVGVDLGGRDGHAGHSCRGVSARARASVSRRCGYSGASGRTVSPSAVARTTACATSTCAPGRARTFRGSTAREVRCRAGRRRSGRRRANSAPERSRSRRVALRAARPGQVGLAHARAGQMVALARAAPAQRDERPVAAGDRQQVERAALERAARRACSR